VEETLMEFNFADFGPMPEIRQNCSSAKLN